MRIAIALLALALASCAIDRRDATDAAACRGWTANGAPIDGVCDLACETPPHSEDAIACETPIASCHRTVAWGDERGCCVLTPARGDSPFTVRWAACPGTP